MFPNHHFCLMPDQIPCKLQQTAENSDVPPFTSNILSAPSSPIVTLYQKIRSEEDKRHKLEHVLHLLLTKRIKLKPQTGLVKIFHPL